MAEQQWRVFTAENSFGTSFALVSTLWTDQGPQAATRKVLLWNLDEATATRMAELTQREYDTVRNAFVA